jgi:hypothetical protein
MPVVNVLIDAISARAKRRERVIKPPEFESMKTNLNADTLSEAGLH